MSESFSCDTSRRTPVEWTKGLAFLLVGLTVAHFGVTLFLIADLGLDTFTSFVAGLAGTIGISVGTCHVAVCILLMSVMAVTTKGYIKPGTVLCAFCGGWIIDLFRRLLGNTVTAETALPIRVVVMAVGCVFLSLGMSMVINSTSGTGPNDLISIILHDKLTARRIPIRFFITRMTVDAVLVLLGWAFGMPPGIGTIVAVFLTGPVVQFFLPITRKLAPVCCRSVS